MSHVTDVTNSKSHAETLLEQGVRHYHNHHLQEALEAFAELEKINPTCSDLFLHRGNAYFQLEKYDLAREAFEQAITLDPMEGNAYLNLGKMFFKIEQYGLAVYYWELSKALVKNNQNLWLNLGIAYDKLYEPDKAMNAYSIYMGLQPSAMEAAKLSVRFEQARKIFENNIQIVEELLKKGERAKAMDILRKELMAYSAPAKVYKLYASLLYQSGALKDALKAYLKAYDLKKGEPDATVLTNIAVLYEKLAMPASALWAYTQLVVNKLSDDSRIIQHQSRLIDTLQKTADSVIPKYIQEIRDRLRHPMQAEEGRRLAEQLDSIKYMFPTYSDEISSLMETANEVFSPSLRAAKTYFNMGEDARNGGKFDQALEFYQKYLILQSKGEKANLARKYLQEMKQVMGAVVTALIQSDDSGFKPSKNGMKR